MPPRIAQKMSRQGVHFLAKRQSHAACLVLCLLELSSRVGIGDDTGADVVIELAVFVNEGADGDIELGFAIEAKVSNGAGVESAGNGFEFGDNFSGSFLGGAGDRAAGEAGCKGGEGRVFGSEGAANGRDKVVNVLQFFKLEHVGDLDRAEFADLAEVVAEEVGDHDELGAFLFGILEVEGGLGVEFGISEAGAGSFDGAGLDLPAGETQKGFGRGREDFASTEVKVGGGGSGGGVAELLVKRKEPLGSVAFRAETSRKVHLVDVTGGDVFLNGFNSGEEIGAFQGIPPRAEGEIGGVFWIFEGGGKSSRFPPFAGLVMVNKEFGVDAEGVAAIIVDPPAGSTGWEPIIAG